MIARGWPSCSGTLGKFIPALSFLGLRCKMRVLVVLFGGSCCAESTLPPAASSSLVVISRGYF